MKGKRTERIRSCFMSMAFGLLITGCSSKGSVKEVDLRQFVYGESNVEEVVSLTGSRTIEDFQYRVDESNYYFLKYHIPSTRNYIDILFQDELLRSIVKSDGWGNYGFRYCIVFPMPDGLDPYQCLVEATEEMIAQRAPLHSPVITGEEAEYHSGGPIAVGAELATISFFTGGAPLTAGALMAPVLAMDAASRSSTRKEMMVVQLGTPESEYDEVLGDLPDHAISQNARSKSILIPKGTIFTTPKYSIGIHDQLILWLYPEPSWRCSGVFSVKGCEIGWTRKEEEEENPTTEGASVNR